MRSALVFLLLLAALRAFGAGLGPEDRRRVDGVRIDPQSGVLTLILVIDRPLEDGLTKASARSKLLGYRQWLQMPAFSAKFPTAKPEKGVHVIILHPLPRNALGRSVLEQLEGYAREIGFKPSVQLIRPKEDVVK